MDMIRRLVGPEQVLHGVQMLLAPESWRAAGVHQNRAALKSSPASQIDKAVEHLSSIAGIGENGLGPGQQLDVPLGDGIRLVVADAAIGGVGRAGFQTEVSGSSLIKEAVSSAGR